MTTRGEIETATYSVLRRLAPRKDFNGSSRIIKDIRLHTDDATAMALELERRLGVFVPRDEWLKVFTVDDVIDALARAAGTAKA